MESVSKPVQIRIKCGESFLLIAWLQAAFRRFGDSCHQLAAGWKYDFQSALFSFQCGEEEAVTEPPSNLQVLYNPWCPGSKRHLFVLEKTALTLIKILA